MKCQLCGAFIGENRIPGICEMCSIKDSQSRTEQRDKIIKNWFQKHSEYVLNILYRRKK